MLFADDSLLESQSRIGWRPLREPYSSTSHVPNYTTQYTEHIGAQLLDHLRIGAVA